MFVRVLPNNDSQSTTFCMKGFISPGLKHYNLNVVQFYNTAEQRRLGHPLFSNLENKDNFFISAKLRVIDFKSE